MSSSKASRQQYTPGHNFQCTICSPRGLLYLQHTVKLKHTCKQDADRLWAVSPPAEAALRLLLQSPAAELRVGWRVERNAPAASAHGGPVCNGAVAVRLAGASRSQLLEVLDVSFLEGTSILMRSLANIRGFCRCCFDVGNQDIRVSSSSAQGRTCRRLCLPQCALPSCCL